MVRGLLKQIKPWAGVGATEWLLPGKPLPGCCNLCVCQAVICGQCNVSSLFSLVVNPAGIQGRNQEGPREGKTDRVNKGGK